MKFPIHCPIENSRVARLIELRYCWQAPPRQTVNTLMILLFGLLHMADGVVTYQGLSFADVDEVNPVLNYFAAQLGLGVAIALLKFTIIAVITLIFYERCSIKSRWGTVTLASADTFYSWVVTNNFILVLSS